MQSKKPKKLKNKTLQTTVSNLLNLKQDFNLKVLTGKML